MDVGDKIAVLVSSLWSSATLDAGNGAEADVLDADVDICTGSRRFTLHEVRVPLP